MNKPVRFYLVLSLLVPGLHYPSASSGAGNSFSSSNYWVSYLNPSLISEITESGGELFMATLGGLLIYDLTDSTFSRVTNTSGLLSNALTSLAFDKEGNLYVGTEKDGIMKLVFQAEGIDVTSINATFHGIADDRITTVALWGDTLVYGTKGGAGVIFGDFFRPYKGADLPDEFVSDLLVDGGRVWIATRGGIAVLGSDGLTADFSAGLPDPDTRAMAKSDSLIWAGTAKGVAQFNPADSTWSSIGLTNKKIFSLYYDGSELWAGSGDSLYVYDGAGWTPHNLINTFFEYQLDWARYTEIRTIFREPGGDAFIGMGDWTSDRRGCNLVVLKGDGSIEVLVPNSLPDNTILRLSLDLDGSLWVSTNVFGVGKLTPNGLWMNYNKTTPGGANLSFRIQNNALLADSEGKKWFGTISNLPPLDELDDGLDTDYGNDIWNHHQLGSGGGDGLGALRFIRAREDPAGNRWFLSDDEYKDEVPPQRGINILSQDMLAWKQVNSTSTLSQMKGDNIFDVAFDPDGGVYVAILDFGVQKWITGGYDQIELFDLSDDIWITIGEIGDEFSSAASILSLALRSDGTLWIGTTVGLYRYYGGIITYVRPKVDADIGILLGNHVRDMAFDKAENLWVATDLGLNRLARDDYTNILYYTTPTAWQRGLSRIFKDPSKVLSPLANAECNALALDQENNILYIGTGAGLSSFDITSIEEQSTDLSEVYLYPNPIRFGRGDKVLKIANIHSTVTVYVYNLEGELLHEQSVSSSNAEVWNLTTAEGFLAASGVYFVKVRDDTGSIVKTISLIR